MSGHSYSGRNPPYWGTQGSAPYDDEEGLDIQGATSPYDMTALSQSLPLYGDQSGTLSDFTANPYGLRNDSVGSWCAPGMLGSLSDSREGSRRASGSSPYHHADSNPTTWDSQQVPRRNSVPEPLTFNRGPVRRGSHSAYNGLGSNFDIPEDRPSQSPMRSYPPLLDTQGLVDNETEDQGPYSPGLMRMSLQPGDDRSQPSVQAPDFNTPRRRDSIDSQQQQRVPHRSHSKRSKSDGKRNQHGTMPKRDRYPHGDSHSKSAHRDSHFEEAFVQPVNAQAGRASAPPSSNTVLYGNSGGSQHFQGDNDDFNYILDSDRRAQEDDVPRTPDSEAIPFEPFEHEQDRWRTQGTSHGIKNSRTSSSKHSNKRR